METTQTNAETNSRSRMEKITAGLGNIAAGAVIGASGLATGLFGTGGMFRNAAESFSTGQSPGRMVLEVAAGTAFGVASLTSLVIGSETIKSGRETIQGARSGIEDRL